MIRKPLTRLFRPLDRTAGLAGCCLALVIAAMLTAAPPAVAGDLPDGHALVKGAWDYLRGETSKATVEMTIHRPDWQRTMTLVAWTKGDDKSLFTITSPPKDAGNGTLKTGDQMWMYNPKVNRIIRLPPSMMSQSWMGSDFSNNDLSKTDSVPNDYNHKTTGSTAMGGHTAYTVESIPKPQAAVVWGKLVLVIRDDHVLLSQTYYDQDMKPVKKLTCSDVKKMGGKLYPATWLMTESDDTTKYTRVDYKDLEFGVKLAADLFTQQSLRNPRQ